MIVACLLVTLYATSATATSSTAGPPTIHVDPTAQPGGDGSPTRPFVTLPEARDTLRRRDTARPGPIEIILHGGTYQMDRGFVLDRRDAGRPDAPIIYRAAPGEHPRLIGALEQTNIRLEPVTDPAILSRLPDQAARANVRRLDLVRCFGRPAVDRLAGPVHRGMGLPVVPVASELFINDRPLTPARWPNRNAPNGGFAKIETVVDPGTTPRDRADDVPEAKRETRPPRGGTIAFDNPRITRWTRAEAPFLFGYYFHDWADEQIQVESIDAETKRIKLALPHRYGMRAGGRFYITNLIEELDQPGEYFIDRTAGVLYVWPPTDAPLRRLDITTLAEPVIRLEDTHDIQIIGLEIACTRGPAIVAQNVSDVLIAECTLRNTGTHGIVLSGRNNTIRDNELVDLGATGISVAGGDRATLSPARNKITNNDIYRFGRVYRTYQPGIRLAGVGQIVTNNRLHDAPHSALMFAGNDHRIERNEIFDVLKETGDCGAIYCGRDWTLHGNVIKNNLFHDLAGTDARYQNAVYLDDMASGIQVVGNIFYNCHWGMLIGGGRDVTVRGNVFIGGSKAISFDARGTGWMAPAIADTKTSTLHKNLERVPYRKPPWSERFPQLQTYLTVGFGRPIGSAVVGNAIFGCPLGTIADRQSVRVSDNRILETTPTFITRSPTDPLRLRFNVDTVTIPNIPGFEPIPVNHIGLFRDKSRCTAQIRARNH